MTPRSANLSWKDTFCNTIYSQAGWIGVLVCVNQHLNGNLGVIYYSSIIFEKAGVSVRAGNFIILLANVVGNIPGYFLIQKCGRRPLMLWSMVSISVLYVICTITAIHDQPWVMIVAISLIMAIL
jgi:Na+/melibiose symporter-like transporter